MNSLSFTSVVSEETLAYKKASCSDVSLSSLKLGCGVRTYTWRKCGGLILLLLCEAVG